MQTTSNIQTCSSIAILNEHIVCKKSLDLTCHFVAFKTPVHLDFFFFNMVLVCQLTPT